MTSYIAKTNEDWVAFLIDEGITDSVNHWRVYPQPYRKDLPGNILFFFAKSTSDDKRRLVGWGTVREFMTLSVQETWDRFKFGNGAGSLTGYLELLNSSSSNTSQVNSTTIIGDTIVDDVFWLDNPIDIESLGVKVASNIVAGRGITSVEEERKLLGGYAEEASEEARQMIINLLNQQYRDSLPNTRSSVSKRIERNPVLVRLLKQLHPDHCQLCEDEFFWKRGHKRKYSEVHHIRELSVGGKDAADNCLVLCANCHRKMHHGDVEIQDLGHQLLVTETDHAPHIVQKNMFNAAP
jgi:hypothetical protein